MGIGLWNKTNTGGGIIKIERATLKFIVSRYNNDISWLKDYTNDVVLYDRSEEPLPNAIVMPNIGSDIYDKFTYIIDNYDNLPDVAVYTKGNLFKFIRKEEFDKVCNNKTFTPLLTKFHKVQMPVACYQDGMYYEINNYFYLIPHPAKHAEEIIRLFRMNEREYNAFAPGSNYIIPKENILRHPKQLYEKLRSFLDWAVYPGDAQLIERNLHYLWGTDIIGGI